uniref:Uncharacterized protein n=1 Tax=Panagrolaimus sp. PS1159 TaxID=55785 RepID=A0AC35ER69_9BILA
MKQLMKKSSTNVICCKHGRPCVIGRRSQIAAAKAKEKYNNPPGYEIVKISKLDNPPTSFSHRRSPPLASNNIDSPKE